jgi:pimeloyl-ACP methyl ester carboxylesterase
MKHLEHGRVRLALRELRVGPGPVLLAVHALGGSGADWGDALAPWPGSAYALDLTGHGDSAPLRGEGYYPELLAGDVDVVVAAVGATHLVGRGLGAYLALLVAGSRPAAIRGTLLLPGAGLDGGGDDVPLTNVAARFEPFRQAHFAARNGGPDPALRILESDIRPADYARTFGLRAHALLLAEDGTPRPPWWAVLRELQAVQSTSIELGVALEQLALAS